MDLSKIKEGYLIFTKDNSLISKLIRYVECGGVIKDVPSHVGIVHYVYEDSDIMINTIEAFFNGGVKFGSANNYFRPGVTVWFAKIKKFNPEVPIEWAEDQVHTRYDFTAIFGILLRYLIRKYSLNKIPIFENILDKKQRFFCSEFVSEYAMKGKVRLWKGDPSFHTPRDIFRSSKITVIGKVEYNDDSSTVPSQSDFALA